jgi:hypothetical protein
LIVFCICIRKTRHGMDLHKAVVKDLSGISFRIKISKPMFSPYITSLLYGVIGAIFVSMLVVLAIVATG